MNNDDGPRLLSVPATADAQRLDNFLLRQLKGVPRSLLYRLLRKGAIRLNGRRVGPEVRVATGDQVRIPTLTGPGEAPVSALPPKGLLDRLRASVVFEDADFLVLDKPAGLAVHAGSGLRWGLIEAARVAWPQMALELGHRLDRETSGVLVLTKSRRALLQLHEVLRQHQAEKRYLALLVGDWTGGSQECLLPLTETRDAQGLKRMQVTPSTDGAPERAAHSFFEPLERFSGVTLERFSGFTLAAVRIGTGRTHQIRVHARALGFPVAGDYEYGDPKANRFLRSFGLTRLALHAQALEFTDWAGERRIFSSLLPDDLQQVLAALRGSAQRKPVKR